MQVSKFTKEIAKAVGSSIKPEPWLHCTYANGGYAVWIWDTRKVVDSGSCNTLDKSLIKPVPDSHKPLVGGGREATAINDAFANKSDSIKAKISNGGGGDQYGIYVDVQNNDKWTRAEWIDDINDKSSVAKAKAKVAKKYGKVVYSK